MILCLLAQFTILLYHILGRDEELIHLILYLNKKKINELPYALLNRWVPEGTHLLI